MSPSVGKVFEKTACLLMFAKSGIGRYVEQHDDARLQAILRPTSRRLHRFLNCEGGLRRPNAPARSRPGEHVTGVTGRRFG